MQLPESFVLEMESILGGDFPSFLKALNEGNSRPGLRVNTLKIGVEDFLELAPWPLERIPWSEEGFYYPLSARPAKHPYYHAGLFYLQEPSAMAPVAILDPKPGDKVLDLCSAPGGKTLQIAAKIKGNGLIVANDLYPDRLKALNRNVEQAGIKNVTILNETSCNLQKTFTGFFDKILIDAPCSGEGMFRKDPRGIKGWQEYPPVFCQKRQRGILEEASSLLKPGGILVYSTCTFNCKENEDVLREFLSNNQDFEGIVLKAKQGLVQGQDYYTLRLWPHKVEGEGHFVAKLKKKETKVTASPASARQRGDYPELFQEFWHENIDSSADDFTLESYGNHLFYVRKDLPSLDGLKVSRPGWFLGELKTKRFVPSQALIMALTKDEVKNRLVLDLKDQRLNTYLRGQTFNLDSLNGWTGVFLEEHPLGWGKVSNKTLKNHYPKGWRMV
ncbi:MAG: RsmB/NOP family class I SAM-dependent RNA methyltransferase [Firmicutes bacterium]|nr:RsmB/NOP family class I SAM-dependent RNA methyltransferase [Bacillota bacterium]MDD4263753.1 RsmB/NOP family class I SAM-dependent RNA methyltransferase [Bacillota bacterium]MDD4694305.1 RsmB/NOP family class I SAM-dependent RNA methyltransferase [Bacillota bacterium]